MNIRLDPKLLLIGIDGLPYPTELLPDEPIFSFITRWMHLAVELNRMAITEALFGRKSIRTERPLHAGFAHFAERISTQGTCPNEILDRHSLFALFKPFMDQSRFQDFRELLKGPSANGVGVVAGGRQAAIFRSTPAICLKCLEADLSTHSFGYYRRSHLIRAVWYCAEHQTPLIEICPSCAAPFSHWELPAESCSHCRKKIVSPIESSTDNANKDALIRLSEVIAAVLSGKIGWVNERQRLAAFRKRISQIVSNRSSVLGDNLARHLERTFGQNFLACQSLLPNHAPTIGWPALIIHGHYLAEDPIANAVIIAGAFNSVDHYLDFLGTLNPTEFGDSKPSRREIGARRVTMPVLRDVLRLPALHLVSSKHGISRIELKKWVAAYPGLSNRRNAKQTRKKLANHKKTIVEQLTSNPGMSLFQLARHEKGAVKFLQRHDPVWLNENLHAYARIQDAGAIWSECPDAAHDRLLCNQLADVIAKAKGGRGRPVRNTKIRLIEISGLGGVPKSMRADFPETFALIDELAESEEDFYRRSLQWAAIDLTKRFGSCCNIVELYVHAHVSLNCVRPLAQFAQSLLDRE